MATCAAEVCANCSSDTLATEPLQVRRPCPALLQGRLWSALTVVQLDTLAATLRFVAGCSVWALGWTVNLHSDALLRNLRKPGDRAHFESYLEQLVGIG